MKHGFVKVAAAAPRVKVADAAFNTDRICELMEEAFRAGAKITVFPELCITGYTCQDLFFQDALLAAALDGLVRIRDASSDLDGIFFVGLPIEIGQKLYDAAAAVSAGRILGIVPKTYISDCGGSSESRYFASGADAEALYAEIGGEPVPVLARGVFRCAQMPSLAIGAEIGSEMWALQPTSEELSVMGATVIANLSATYEGVGRRNSREETARGISRRCSCAYVHAGAGPGESTQDLVFGGHCFIAENGSLLAVSEPFSEGITYTEIDTETLAFERRRLSGFFGAQCDQVAFDLALEDTEITRYIDPAPFVPDESEERSSRCAEILAIQAAGLKKRMEHINCGTAVIGVSGGLDSTLALVVTAKTFDMLGLGREGIIAVTMPGFGTTDRTYDNAVRLIERLGATFREISIKDSVTVHFADIGHDPGVHDAAYENAQARERTQILMDVANMENGLVVGTGDLSELALGWATYNGDHMSMYDVNGSIPKTLVRHLVRSYADTCGDEALKATLYDVLDTPVSPELLPPEDGKISQKTEELVGPYELHDFFIYHMLRRGEGPSKIFRLAKIAFAGAYDDRTILKWLGTFCRRFFSQQFKRSCLPDGPKVGSVDVSPRGGLRMPSDACSAVWMDEVKALEAKLSSSDK